jgi:predicted transcriptional regulator
MNKPHDKPVTGRDLKALRDYLVRQGFDPADVAAWISDAARTRGELSDVVREGISQRYR